MSQVQIFLLMLAHVGVWGLFGIWLGRRNWPSLPAGPGDFVLGNIIGMMVTLVVALMWITAGKLAG